MPAPEHSAVRPPRTAGSLNEVTIQVFVMLALLVVLVAVTGLMDRNFFQPISLRSVSRDVAILGLLALGQAVVIIGGGIDLSSGSLVSFFGVLVMVLLGKDCDCSLATTMCVVVVLAILVGLAHGLLICRLALQPFLVTLCSLLIFRGLSRVLSGDSTLLFDAGEHPLLAALGGGTLGGLPIPLYILAAAMIPLGFFLHFTVSGRYLFALGNSLEAARFSGIRVTALRVFSYVVCAVLAALAALLEAGSVGSVTPSTAGIAYEMYAITAAVLGGCALGGGQGSLIGVVAGAAILRLLRSTVIFSNLSVYWTFTVTGLVLLAAVIADALVKRYRESR
jgi:ribose transport system permease protein